jgi:hypothetical protein
MPQVLAFLFCVAITITSSAVRADSWKKISRLTSPVAYEWSEVGGDVRAIVGPCLPVSNRSSRHEQQKTHHDREDEITKPRSRAEIVDHILSARHVGPSLDDVALYPGEVERQGPAMPITERTSHRLVLKSGLTTLTLDKTAEQFYSVSFCCGDESQWR